MTGLKITDERARETVQEVERLVYELMVGSGKGTSLTVKELASLRRRLRALWGEVKWPEPEEES